MTHVVFTHRSDGSEVVYVDGVHNTEFSRLGGVSNWDPTYPLVVGNETNGARPFLGELHLIAIYDRALPEDEVVQNHLAGP